MSPPGDPEGRAAAERRAEKRPKMPARGFPDLILIDGGKGQLGMAVAELKQLGLERFQ